ncbi:hypothetical protein ABTL95_20305, partial [Acinetobacter baumannii]
MAWDVSSAEDANAFGLPSINQRREKDGGDPRESPEDSFAEAIAAAAPPDVRCLELRAAQQ